MQKSKKSEGCTTGLFLGSVMRVVIAVLGFIFKILAKITMLFGLWIPAVYALFGLALYLAFKFNPFDFSLYSTLYLSGAVGCVVGSFIIAIKNLVVTPAKSVYAGYKHPIWEKTDKEDVILKNNWESHNQAKKEKDWNPPEIEEYKSDKTVLPEYLIKTDDFQDKTKEERESAKQALFPNWFPKNSKMESENTTKTVVVSEPKAERPKIYFSKLEGDILVHEYSDRFELYKLDGSRTVPLRVEYK